MHALNHAQHLQEHMPEGRITHSRLMKSLGLQAVTNQPKIWKVHKSSYRMICWFYKIVLGSDLMLQCWSLQFLSLCRILQSFCCNLQYWFRDLALPLGHTWETPLNSLILFILRQESQYWPHFHAASSNLVPVIAIGCKPSYSCHHTLGCCQP